MKKVIVIGGGAAGMMAAIQAAKAGCQVSLLEKNEKLGKKIYITGKGRCNLTNACSTEELFLQVLRNRKFLYHAFYSFSNWQVMDFFEDQGLSLKTERGGRVFPSSDHSSDVIRALQRVLSQEKVTVRLHTQVAGIVTEELSRDLQNPVKREDIAAEGRFSSKTQMETVRQRVKGTRKKTDMTERRAVGVLLANGEKLYADAVILATGGCSYASTGSTGEGYDFAASLGHKVIKPAPSLVPFEVLEEWVKDLQGLSLRNVNARIYKEKKLLYEAFGEMLFTHYGVSGPLMLSASSVITDDFRNLSLDLRIDLKPALTEEQLDKRVQKDFQENQNRQFKNAVQKLFPTKLIPIMVNLSGISPERKVNEITREERQNFVRLIKAFPLTLSGLRGFQEAIITRGGICVKEVNPATMESKLVQGLYFAGEVLDLDALTGGFNLQIAWSTGYLAGESAGA